MRVAAVLVALVLGLAAGCGGDDDESGTPTLDGTTRVLVYLTRGEDVAAVARQVPFSGDTPTAAVTSLLEGPSATEEGAGLGTAIPDGTTLNGIDVEDGVATVDLSTEFDDGGGSAGMFMRLAQIVHTVTQTANVTGVQFELDGEPVTTFSSEGIGLDGPQTREDFEDQAPAILVERPAFGDPAGTPMEVRGTANTFEATLQYEVLDAAGEKIAGTFLTATCGTGCRGTFEETVSLEEGAQPATLVMFENSAEDGSRINVVEIPLADG